MRALLSCHCRAGLNYHPVSSDGCLTAVQSHRDICWAKNSVCSAESIQRDVYHNLPSPLLHAKIENSSLDFMKKKLNIESQNSSAVYRLREAHENIAARMFISYNHVGVGDASDMVILSKKSSRPPSSVIFFHVKPATLNFLLSLLCGPPFMSVTEPCALTIGLNLISFFDSVQSSQL